MFLFVVFLRKNPPLNNWWGSGGNENTQNLSAAHLVGQIGQQIQNKVPHPLDELLQGLEEEAIQHKLLRLQIDHHLINI